MKVRVNTYKVFEYLDTTGVVVDVGLLTVAVLDSADVAVVVPAPVVTQNAVIPDLYLAATQVFTLPGGYTLSWSYNGTVIESEQFEVGYDPVPDFRINVVGDLRYQSGAGDTVTATIIDSAGSQVGAVLATVYNAATLSHEVANTFTLAGSYLVVWFVGPGGGALPKSADHLFVYQPRAKFTTTVTLNDGSANLSGVNIVFSTAAGVPVTLATTDVAGQVHVDLPVGTYTASFQRIGDVFTTNNYVVEVVDPATTAGNNQSPLLVEYFTPTFALAAPPSGLTTLYLQLFDMTGEPFPNAHVMVQLVDSPAVLAGNIVWGTAREFKTDATGYASFDLIEGIQVEITITPLSLRRRITVPVSNVAVNIATLLSSANDAFDILTPVVPTAPRRAF